MWLRKYGEQLLGLIYPKSCFGCQRPLNPQSHIYLCFDCWNKLGSSIIPPFCTICGRPIDMLDVKRADKCSLCTEDHYYFKLGYTAALYDGLVKDCIHSFKYSYNTYLAGTLAQLMINFSLRYIEFKEIDVLVSVPLHWKRLRERGFNQAELLAKKISVRLGIPLEKRGLCRIRHILSQTQLQRQERLHNVKGAFVVKRADSFTGKRILLVDDVFTTGATLNECSRVLLQAGAKEVWVFSLARGVS